MGQEERGREPIPSGQPFITTSDVISKLNQNLKELAEPGEILEPRFELQKRLPDGSTIPASPSDVALSDAQTKIQQSAAFVAQLAEPDKVLWAEEQRKAGNALFARGDYKNAMDIYLTCLVVKQKTHSFVETTLVPVLSNLAQCTLQLGMHKKTVEFCRIALEEIAKHQPLEGSDRDHSQDSFVVVADEISLCKLYFKRAKARRLMGEYADARADLHRASSSLSLLEEAEEVTRPYRTAIRKEYRLLDGAEKEARQNKLRQRNAMRRALSSSKPESNLPTTSRSPEVTPSSMVAPRTHSGLRARRTTPAHPGLNQDLERDEGQSNLSYFQYYWLVVGRVAEVLLVWLGDEETKQRLEKEVHGSRD